MSVLREAPFDNWPTEHVDPNYGYAWYCGAGLIVSHITVTHATAAAAHAYHDFEGAMLREHAEEIAANNGIFVIHDWRRMETYESDGRRVWLQRMSQRKKGYLRGSVVCLLRAGALLRMAVQSANLAASLTHNAKVSITTDINAVLREHHAVPRLAGTRHA
jgi:hypothetical protein